MTQKVIQLVSAQGHAKTVPLELAKRMKIVQDMLDHMQDDQELQPVPLMCVDTDLLDWTLAFLERHPDKVDEDLFDYSELKGLPLVLLVRLVNAFDYLEIEDGLQVLTMYMGDLFTEYGDKLERQFIDSPDAIDSKLREFFLEPESVLL